MFAKRWISMLMAIVLMVTSLPMRPSAAEMLIAAGAEIIGTEVDENGNTLIVAEKEVEATPVAPEDLAVMPVNAVLAEAAFSAVEDTVYDDGTWHYTVDAEGYACITGVSAPQAAALKVPQAIGGHLVRAIGANAFDGAPMLSVLSIPGSVVSIAPGMLGALRTQVTIEGYNGTAAMRYARTYAVASRSLSALYFTESIIDFTGARSGAYQMVDQDTVRFDTLEGSQLKVGSLFYLPDTQSGYKVTSIQREDGWIVADTAEPEVQECLTRFVADLSKMRMDTENIRLADGVTMVGYTEKLAAEGELTLFKPELEVYKEFKFGSKAAIEFTASVGLGITLNGEIDVDILGAELNKFKLVAVMTLDVQAAVTGKLEILTIPLGEFPLASVVVLSAMIKVSFDVEVSAALKYTYTFGREFGVEYNKKTKKLDLINNPIEQEKTTAEGKLTFLFKASLSLDAPVLGEIAKIAANGGVEYKLIRTLSGTSDGEVLPEVRGKCRTLEVNIIRKAESEIITPFLKLKRSLFDLSYQDSVRHFEPIPGDLDGHYELVPECTFASDDYVSLFIDRGDGTPVEEARVKRGSNLGHSPQYKQRPGYTAVNWYTHKDASKPFSFSDPLTEDTRIYMLWVENGRRLTIHDDVLGDKYIIVSAGQPLSYTLAEDSVALQNVFHGWYYDKAFTKPVDLAEAVMPDDGLEVYAKWEYKADHNPFTDTNAQSLAMLVFRPNVDRKSYAVAACNDCAVYIEVPDYHMGKPVTAIDDEAFKDCASLAYLKLGENVKTIGEEAFSGCSALTYLGLGGSVQSIGKKALKNCESLTKIDLPASLTLIDEYAFQNCKALAEITIPASVTKANTYLFTGCSALAKASIPDSWTILPSGIFYNCASLANVNIPSGLTTVGSYAFYECAGLKKVVLPSTVTKINGTAFAYCTALESLNLPAGLTTLGSGALAYSGLSSVTLPEGVTRLAENTFMGMSNLRQVNLHDKLLEIGSNCFAECTALESITIPASVTTLSKACFSGSGLTSLVIPSTVTSVGKEICRNCASLASVTLPSNWGLLTDGFFQDCTALKSIQLPAAMTQFKSGVFMGSGLESITLPEGTETVSWQMFDNCDSLVSVTLPSTITSIAFQAFYGCENLEEIYLPYGVTSIADWAFGYCPSLINVWVPPTVTSIGGHSFDLNLFGSRGATIIAEVGSYAHTYADTKGLFYSPCTYEVPETTAVAKTTTTTSDGFEYYIFGDGAHIVSYSGDVTNRLTIPDTLGGAPVVAIEEQAMDGAFKYVTLPASLQSVDPTAFEPAENLVSFTVAGESEYFQAVSSALFTRNTTPVRLVAFPRGYSGAYSIPGGVQNIGSSAFSYAEKLTSVTLPSSVVEIEGCAFEGCTALASAALNDGLVTIGPMAMLNCTALSSLTLPATATAIDSTAMLGCDVSLYGPVGDCAAREFALSMLAPYNRYTLSFWFEDRLIVQRQVEAGQLLGEAFVPESDYNTFSGWYKENSLKNLWDFSAGVMPKADLSLYGGWTSDFVCTVDAGAATITGYAGDMGVLVIPDEIGGIPVKAIAPGALASTADKVILSVTVPYGVESIGEGALSGVEEIVGDNGSAAQTFAGSHGMRFVQRKYTLRFETGKGTPAAEQQLAYGSAIQLPDTVLDNHQLCGWFTSAEFEKLWTSAAMPAHDLTLHALWLRRDGAYQNDALQYTYSDDGIVITGYSSVAHELNIPESINGIRVTAIGESAFAGNDTLVKVILPDSVTAIGRNAFADSSLSEIELGKGVAVIGESAFAGCRLLNSFALPEKVTAVPNGMLSDCSGIQELVIGDQVTAIGDYAFANMIRLTALTLGNKVETIGAGALEGCSRLESLHLPASLKALGEGALAYCTGLKTLTAAEGSKTFKAADNVLFDLNGTQLIACAANRDGKRYTVPEGVTAIAAYAFCGAQNLTEVTLPASLAAIGTHAFDECEALETCIFNAKSPLSELPEYTFAGCGKLADVQVPDALANIGSYAFMNNHHLALLKLPGNMLSMKQNSFFGCTSLALSSAKNSYVQDYAAKNGIAFQLPDEKVLVKRVVLPLAQTVCVGERRVLPAQVLPAGANDPSLMWTSSDPAVASVSADGVVTGLQSGEATITASARDGSGASGSCTVMVSSEQMLTLKLPSALTAIEAEAFAGTRVQAVDLSGTKCTVIADHAFRDAGALRQIILPATVESISENAFSGCDHVQIVCPAGSKAAQYAQENGIPWMDVIP